MYGIYKFSLQGVKGEEKTKLPVQTEQLIQSVGWNEARNEMQVEITDGRILSLSDLEKINILAADLDGYVTGLRKNRIDNQENYNTLFAGTEELNKQYTKLTGEKDELIEKNSTLTGEKEKIEKDFSNLKSSYDTNINNNKELQSSFDALKKKKKDLEQALGDLQT